MNLHTKDLSRESSANAAPQGRLVEEQSGHAMPLEIPDEIGAQTRSMLEAIRSTG